MIYKGDKQISKIYHGDSPISAVYGGTRQVWCKSRPYIKGTADGNFTLYISYPNKNNQYKNINVTVSNGEFKEYFPEPYQGEQINLTCLLDETSKVSHVEFGGFNGVKVNFIRNFAEWCNNLESADISGLGSCEVSDASYMFYASTNLKTVSMKGFRFGEDANMNGAFDTCSKLHTIDFAGTDFSNVTLFGGVFLSCMNLTTIIGPVTGINADIYLLNSPLTKESAMVIINGLDVVERTTNLTLSASTYAKLSSEDKAIASLKGWSIISDSSSGGSDV